MVSALEALHLLEHGSGVNVHFDDGTVCVDDESGLHFDSTGVHKVLWNWEPKSRSPELSVPGIFQGVPSGSVGFGLVDSSTVDCALRSSNGALYSLRKDESSSGGHRKWHSTGCTHTTSAQKATHFDERQGLFQVPSGPNHEEGYGF